LPTLLALRRPSALGSSSPEKPPWAQGSARAGYRSARRTVRRDPERTRAVILAAATEEITTKGLDGARVDESAQWWKRPGDEVIATCIERYNSVC
jgi:hypothetical protein